MFRAMVDRLGLVTIGRRLRAPAFIFTANISVLVAVACGSSSTTVEPIGASYQRVDRSLPWSVRSVLGQRMIRIGGFVGYCEGRAKPTLKPPRIRYKGDRVFISLELQRRRHGTSRGAHRKQPKIAEGCAGVELFIGQTVALKHDLSQVEIFDSGVNPPRLRWPTP